MRDINNISIEECIVPNSPTNYHAKLGHPYKSYAIKVMVVCYVWLDFMKGISLRTGAEINFCEDLADE